MLRKRIEVSLLVFILLLVQACATQEKKLSIHGFQSVPVIHLVRYETSPFLKDTAGAQAVAMTGIMFGAIGGGLGGAMYYKIMESSGKELADKLSLPDFGDIVFSRFSDRLNSDMSHWPKIKTISEPVDKEYKAEQGFTIIMTFGEIKVVNGTGLSTVTTAKMIDEDNNLLWNKTYHYKSKWSKRVTNIDELEAENGKLLKEEFAYAAEMTIADLMQHLNAGHEKERNIQQVSEAISE